MSNLKLSTDISILVQIIIGLITLRGTYILVNDEDEILLTILKLEALVQLIELLYYIIVIRNVGEDRVEEMASLRYLDWLITTPTMLLTTIIYFKWEENRGKTEKNKLTLKSFIEENKSNIIIIFICNSLMLLSGYLGEKGYIDMKVGLIVGFIFFYISFENIYRNYGKKSERGLIIYKFLVFIWSLYGVGYILNAEHKNILYNILDIIAKNFFGLYLYYVASTVSIKKIEEKIS